MQQGPPAFGSEMPTDLDIARQVTLKPIVEIADQLGIPTDLLEPYGRFKAKLPLRLLEKNPNPTGKLILVSAISPTPAGEGKTTMSIGLSQGLNRLGNKTTVVLREPSLGPVFGIKGGATGGGWSQVLPMEEINLHFTGDFSAIEKAHNLLAALIDNQIQSKDQTLRLDPRTIAWKRVMDVNDRALRKIVVGLGGTGNGIPRETGFDITAASEIMAILCLCTGLADLKRRLGNIFVGFTWDRQPVYARDLKAEGAMAALLKDAIKPNLVQTIEGTPAIIHGGPFANIAQGTNSVLATRMGLALSDYVVTEAGFGSDLGAEKFLDIKCVSADLRPQALVLVATVRALKYHGGQALNQLTDTNPVAVLQGLENLKKHVENAKRFQLPTVVAINRFASDSDEEIQTISTACQQWNTPVAVADVWGQGGAGAETLAKTVLQQIPETPLRYQPLYDWEQDVRSKIETICTKIYGADGVDYSQKAEADLRRIDRLGLNQLPICMAKTQKSLSDDPTKIGRPTNFRITIREIEVAAGAGFLIPITGEMMRMPGLPAVPAAANMDITDDGEILGLF